MAHQVSLQLQLEFDDAVAVVLCEHGPLCFLEKLCSLPIELLLALEMFAREDECTQWASIASHHVSLQVRGRLV